MKAFGLIALLFVSAIFSSRAFAALSCDLDFALAKERLRNVAVVPSRDFAAATASVIPETDFRALVVVDEKLESVETTVYIKKVGDPSIVEASYERDRLPDEFTFGGDSPALGGRFDVRCRR